MGKKEKDKSAKLNVNKDIIDKTKNNKVKDNESKNNNCNVFCKKILLISVSIFGIALAIGAYQLHENFTYIPELPKLDFNKNWGPNTTDAPDPSVRRYRIVFSNAMEEDIRALFENYRSSNKKKSLEDTAWTYGVNSEAFAQFFSYWLFKYNFRQRARFLNKFEHFKTNIQGLDIHFMHVKPTVDKNVKVYPLLLLHGWPGSIREFYEAIPLLTSVRPGYDFVFEIVAPSLPGFIYSQAPVRRGLSNIEIAIIMRNLMQRLGHSQYYVQGGDFGHAIGSHMATIFPKEVLGFHTNFPVNFSKIAFFTWLLGAVLPTFTANDHVDKMYPLTDKLKFYLEESGYMHLQGTKPDTIGTALQDSPVGLASYILDRFMIFTDPNNKHLTDGGLDKYYSNDMLLDNIMLYWVSGSITSSMRVYKESMNADMEKILVQIPTLVPTWGLRLKYELVHQPDFVLRWKYPNLVGTTTLDYGGHFAAFERAGDFADDLFKAVGNFLKLSK